MHIGTNRIPLQLNDNVGPDVSWLGNGQGDRRLWGKPKVCGQMNLHGFVPCFDFYLNRTLSIAREKYLVIEIRFCIYMPIVLFKSRFYYILDFF